MAVASPSEIQVWDPFVRIAHWTIAIGFFVAYFTEDEVPGIHVWAGYLVGALVLLRIVWGFVGPHYARFTDFVCKPRTAIGYLWDLLLARARRYVGHSPAGGAIVIALLVCLAATVVTGLIVYAEKEGAGPLAPFYAGTPATPAVDARGGAASGEERQGEGREGRRGESAFKEAHEVVANITLFLVILHVLGVILASFVHHENLTRAMITGRKRAEEASTSAPSPA